MQIQRITSLNSIIILNPFSSYNRQTNKRKPEHLERKAKSLTLSHASDDNYFDYDSEAFRSVHIKNIPDSEFQNNNEMFLNSIRDGPKIGNSSSFNDNTIVNNLFK